MKYIDKGIDVQRIRGFVVRLHKTKLGRMLLVLACLGVVLGISGAAYGAHRVLSRAPEGKKVAGASTNRPASVGQPKSAAASDVVVADQPQANQPQGPAGNASGPTPSVNKSSGNTTRYVSVHGTEGCPAEYQAPNPFPAGGWTPPQPITKTMPTQTVTIPNGQDSGTFTFTAPDDTLIMFVNSAGTNTTAKIVSGAGTRTATISVTPGFSINGWDHIYASSVCYRYDLPLSYLRPLPPTLQFTSLNYVESSNSLSYTASGPVQSIQISYYLDGCDATTGACYDTDTVAGTGSSGVINFDPLFPQLDAYFASHTATAINLTLTPVAPGYTSASVSQVFPL
jgi:hypothetical protein